MALTAAEKKLAVKIGKDFEATVLEVLHRLMTVKADNMRFFRLYDTHSANSYLPEAPGDFWGGCPRGPTLIEAKASYVHNSLKACLSNNLDHGQAMQLRLWAEAGHVALVLFYDYHGKAIEVWDGATVGYHRAEGKRLKTTDRLAIFPEEKLHSWLHTYLGAKP